MSLCLPWLLCPPGPKEREREREDQLVLGFRLHNWSRPNCSVGRIQSITGQKKKNNSTPFLSVVVDWAWNNTNLKDHPTVQLRYALKKKNLNHPEFSDITKKKSVKKLKFSQKSEGGGLTFGKNSQIKRDIHLIILISGGNNLVCCYTTLEGLWRQQYNRISRVCLQRKTNVISLFDCKWKVRIRTYYRDWGLKFLRFSLTSFCVSRS